MLNISALPTLSPLLRSCIVQTPSTLHYVYAYLKMQRCPPPNHLPVHPVPINTQTSTSPPRLNLLFLHQSQLPIKRLRTRFSTQEVLECSHFFLGAAFFEDLFICQHTFPRWTRIDKGERRCLEVLTVCLYLLPSFPSIGSFLKTL